MPRFTAAILLLLSALTLPGCLERRLQITSDPPGALVWVNDIELGRTPVEADFTFYGNYDVRVDLDGYEPIRQKMNASQPLYEMPPFDLVAMSLPFNFDNIVKWHFSLKPSLEQTQSKADFEKDLLDRARTTRDKLESDQPPAAQQPAPAPEATTPPATTPGTSPPAEPDTTRPAESPK